MCATRHGHAGNVLLLAGREQPAGRGRWRIPSIICPTTGRRCTWISGRSGSSRFTAAGGSDAPAGDLQGALPGAGPDAEAGGEQSGTLEYFLTERSCLFTRNRAGQPVRANLHHVPWPLEEAEAEIERNDLAHRSELSCRTLSRCCTTRGAWRCMCGPRSWCGRRWRPGRSQWRQRRRR